MEQWMTPTTPQELQAFNEGLEIERYRAGRDTPAPYVAPAPAPVEQAQELTIQPRYIKAVAYAGGGLAVCYSVVAFVAAYAVQIGAVAGAVALIGIVVSGLKKSESGAKNSRQGPPPNDSGEWEWYQEQRQGWRRRAN